MKLRGKREKFIRAIRTELKENKKTFLVYSILRIMVIIMMFLQLFNGNYENVFVCILTLGLMIVPSILQATFRVEFPSTLEIIILLFIFCAEILGEIQSFYIHVPYWDTILHVLNGFVCAALGMSLVEILNKDKRVPFQMSPFLLAMVSFCFSMTIGVLWEFFEFFMDTAFLMDMQKDTVVNYISSTYLDPTKLNSRVIIAPINEVMVQGQDLAVGGYLDIGLIDTMEDLLVNFVGAFLFAILQYIYGKHGDKKVFRNLVPFLQSENKYEKLEEAELKERMKEKQEKEQLKERQEKEQLKERQEKEQLKERQEKERPKERQEEEQPKKGRKEKPAK